MTLKRLVLSVLTLLVALVMGNSLISSLSEPQVANQLQLYQTDLLVQASEWEGSGLPETEVQQFRQAVFGKDALVSASEQYQSVREDAATSLAKLEERLANPTDISAEQAQAIALKAQTQQQLINQIDLRLGLVQVQQNDVAEALSTWQTVGSETGESAVVAAVLADLWRSPPAVRPETELVLDRTLRGWFRNVALARLYSVQDNAEQLENIQKVQAETAERTLIQLSVVDILPAVGGLLGTALLIALIGQRVLRGKQALLAIGNAQWSVPWDWEVVWLVIVGGFLFIGQLALPLVLQLGLMVVQPSSLQAASGLSASELSSSGLASAGLIIGLTSRGKALYSLVFYLLMAASTLGVLYWAIRDYLPLSKEWFRFNLSGRWPVWGFGGYLVALPLMLAVSLLNQQIWQGQGGNNPILQLVLEEQDPIALAMFLFTAAVAAPIFEEILFRGFLLPSLTRYFSTWGAIGLSSLIFAVAHLSFSEVLPLAVLGAILGFVYVRSQNLMTSILLHSTWNSITMAGLFLLGSGGL
ncbi:MAG: type II CAAX endopeptidase family protein [Cyanobacteria bacterium J06623_4]